MSPSELPAWLQAGGVVALAGMVWWEQRSMRKTLEAMQIMLGAALGPEGLRRFKRRQSEPASIENSSDHD